MDRNNRDKSRNQCNSHRKTTNTEKNFTLQMVKYNSLTCCNYDKTNRHDTNHQYQAGNGLS